MNALNMSFLIPEKIHTDRLTLRMFGKNDWKELHEYYSDFECVKYTVRRPFTEGETWQKIASFIGHWLLRGYGPYAIEEKQEKKVLGFAGPYCPIDWPEPEIQWSLIRKYWGKGYASEAVRAVRNMTAQHLPGISFISIIHPLNTNSIKLATAIGAHFEKEFFFREDTWHIYRHAD